MNVWCSSLYLVRRGRKRARPLTKGHDADHDEHCDDRGGERTTDIQPAVADRLIEAISCLARKGRVSMKTIQNSNPCEILVK
jgi:hypothetical protein